MLNLPSNIYNWVLDLLKGHTHCTKFKDAISCFETVNASVIQGSALGPSVFLVNASDLRPIDDGNDMFKFADDTYLVVGADRAHTRESELPM